MLYVLLIFMYIFSFKIYSIFDSTLLVGTILAVYFIFNKEYRNRVVDYLKRSFNKKILLYALLIIVLAVFITTIMGAYDFTYLKTFVHLLGVIAIGYGLYCFIDLKKQVGNIVNYIIIAFLIQTFLQWIFYLIPSFSQLFNFLRSSQMIEVAKRYNGYRGIAITTSGFFSLASAYGVVFLIYLTKYNTIFKDKKIAKFVLFVFLVTGTFFAGRTGFVAILLIPFYYLKEIRHFDYLTFLKKNCLKISLCIIALAALIGISMTNKKMSTLYSFSFELIENVIKGKGFSTGSTDVLIDMYNVDVSAKTVIIGDGKYTEYEDGTAHYYKGVDMGYHRKLFYFGIAGLVLSILFQFSLFNGNYKCKELIFIIIYMFILEFKGEILGMNLMVNEVLILYTCLLSNKEKKLGDFKWKKLLS